MSFYAVIKGNLVDGITIADDPLDTDGKWVCIDGMDPMPGPGWAYENNTFVEPMIVPPPPSPKIITKVAFRFRLKDSEYVAILNAAKNDVEVQAWVETFNMVNSVNLDDPRTKAGLDLLVDKNLLSAARANEILTTPPGSGEHAFG